MIDIKIVFAILIIHWFADFVLQTDKQAKGKSKNWSDLLSHTFNYTMVWIGVGALISCPYFDGKYEFIKAGYVMVFGVITFVAHTITDYFTSRLNSKLAPERQYLLSHPHLSNYFIFKNENWHNFFVSIGFDQILHYVQLFTTYYFLSTL